MVSHVYPPPVSRRSSGSVRKRRTVRPSPAVSDRPPPIDAVPVVPSTVAELEGSVSIGEQSAAADQWTGIPPFARSLESATPAEPLVGPVDHSEPNAGRADPDVDVDVDVAGSVDAERSQILVTEPPGVARGREVSHRFDYWSAEDEMRPASALGRRLVRGAILLALVVAAGALLWVIPESEDSLFATDKPTDRVEATEKPVATSDMPSPSDGPEVEGSLRLLAGSGRLSEAGPDRRSATIVASTVGGEDFGEAVSTAAQDVAVDAPDQPTTTTRPEPTVSPESEWVDSGNGVLVPDVLRRIRFCESTNNYSATNPASTASGAYQFLDKSWDWYGHAARTGVSRAHQATRAQQDQSALLTLQSQGTSPWAASRSCWANGNIDPRYATASPPPARATTTAPTTSETTGTTEAGTGGSSTTATTTSSTTGGTGDTTTSTSTATSNPSTTASTEPSTTTAGPTTTVGSSSTEAPGSTTSTG